MPLIAYRPYTLTPNIARLEMLRVIGIGNGECMYSLPSRMQALACHEDCFRHLKHNVHPWYRLSD